MSARAHTTQNLSFLAVACTTHLGISWFVQATVLIWVFEVVCTSPSMRSKPHRGQFKTTDPHRDALLEGDTLVVWKLDGLGRDLYHLVNTVHDLTARGIRLNVLTGQGAAIDATTAAGKLVFGIFAALAEFERELISERTMAGLASVRARGRVGGRFCTRRPAKVRMAMASMGKPETETNDGDLHQELGLCDDSYETSA